MKLVSFNGIAFSASVTAKWDSLNSPSSSRDAISASRIGADPIMPGIEVGTQVVTASFTPSASSQIENALAGVLAVINPDRPVPNVLAGQMVDGTNVERIAIAGSWRYENVNTLLVDFICQDTGWRATSSTAMLAATTYSANGNFPNLNTGLRDVLPTITVGAVGTRSSKTADFGYESRIPYTLTNNGAEPIINEPWQIGPIKLSAGVPWGAAALLSGGNDLRVFSEGVEWPRSLIGFTSSNFGYGFIWIVIPFLSPGGSITLDIVLNNSAAGSPPVFSYSSTPALPAIDISGEYFASSASTATTVSKASATWVANQWDGGTVMTGTSGVGSGQMRRVTGNTTTQLTVSRAWGANPVSQDSTVIKSGMMGDGGVASAYSALVLTDSSQVWSTSEWIGATVEIMGGTGTGSTGTVTSNTATALTVASWSGTAPAAASTYRVYRTNGVWLYDVRRSSDPNNRPGLWSTNRVSGTPSQVNFDSPGSWYRFVLQRGRDNYSQPRADNTSGSLWFAVMRLRRSRRGRQGDQTEVGVADSVGVSCPFGVIGTQFAYTIRNAKKAGSNPSAGMCEFKGICQESGGEVWATFLSDTTTHDTTASVTDTWYDLTGYGYPIRMGMSLVPNSSDEVPDTDNNTAEVRSTSRYVKLAINPNNVLAASPSTFPGIPTVESCYDTALIIRTGGASSTRPYNRLYIGGLGHRLFLKFTGGSYSEQIKINSETHEVTLVDSAGTFIRRIPWAVQPQEIIDDQDGSATTVVGSRWLPIPPSSIDAAAIYFSDPSGAGWNFVRIALTGKLGYMI